MSCIKEILMSSPEILWIPRRVWEIGRAPESAEICFENLSKSGDEERFRQVYNELLHFHFDPELIQRLGRYGYKENFLNYLQRWRWSATPINGSVLPMMRTIYFSEVLLRELTENYQPTN